MFKHLKAHDRRRSGSWGIKAAFPVNHVFLCDHNSASCPSQQCLQGGVHMKICLSHEISIFNSLIQPGNIPGRILCPELAKKLFEEALNLMSGTEGVTKLLIIQGTSPARKELLEAFWEGWPCWEIRGEDEAKGIGPGPVSIAPIEPSVSPEPDPLSASTLPASPPVCFLSRQGQDSSAVTTKGRSHKHLPAWMTKRKLGGLPAQNTGPLTYYSIWDTIESSSGRQCDQTERAWTPISSRLELKPQHFCTPWTFSRPLLWTLVSTSVTWG